MKALTFLLMCRRRCYGLLIPAGEICGIVKAAYLNPFLALQLCLSWRRHLRRPMRKVASCDLQRHSDGSRAQVAAQPKRLQSCWRILRASAIAITLMVFAGGWAQEKASLLPDAPVSQQSDAVSLHAAASSDTGAAPQAPPAKPAETTAEMLNKEEHQRIMGVVPNFNTVESSDSVARLSPRQKFHLAYKSSVDPFVFLADAFVAGVSQAQNSNPGFGQGAEGYFKRFGASYLDTADGTLWGNAILPVLFKEDPRYFRLGHGSFQHRFLYSASTTVWGRRDNATWGPAYANILGNFVAGGISNAYYPAADRGLEQTLDGALIVTAEGAIGAEFIEFWPDISRHLFKKHPAAP